MRTRVSTLLGASLLTIGCTAPPTVPRAPIVLRSQGAEAPEAVTTTASSPSMIGNPMIQNPMMIATTLVNGPLSPWGGAFVQVADVNAWNYFGWGALAGSLSVAGGQSAGATDPTGSWSSLSGMTNGGLGAAVPTTNWDPRRAWASPSTGTMVGGLESPPGWGNKTWGPATAPATAAAQQTQPGQYNLAHGAGDIGGWGLDTGFFTIPQQEAQQQQQAQQQVRSQMDTYLNQINASATGVPGAGQTKLDASKFPFLHPVKGQLVPSS